MSQVAGNKLTEQAQGRGYPGFGDLGRGLAGALAALLLSALILAPLYLWLSPELAQQRAAAAGGTARPWSFDSGDLIARRGAGKPAATGGLQITRLEGSAGDTRAIFTRRVGFNSADYPFVEYQVSGRNPVSFYYFIWRTADQPDTTHHVALPDTGDGTAIALLANHPHWKGSITEVGFDIYGELRGDTQVIGDFTLLPTSSWNFVRAIWAQWAGLETWSQISAHHLMGGPYDPQLARPLAMACWAAAAVGLLLLARLALASDIRLAILLAVLVPWLVIDLLWQHNLSAQLAETRLVFGGKTQHEKHLAELDADLYQYAQYLKREVLPEPGVKIYLLHDSPRRDYRRLKMQFYLLPHNIYNFDAYPPRRHLQPGDYLLVLDAIPNLKYRKKSATLKWDKHAIAVEAIDHEGPGKLYRYTGAP